MSIQGPQGRTRSIPPEAIAFVRGKARLHTELPRVLRRSVGHVAQLDSPRAIDGCSSFALVAVHYDALTPEEQVDLLDGLARCSPRPTLLLLSEGCSQQDLAKLFGSHTLTNSLVIHETGVDISDLLVTVQKIRRRDIFGLEKYFMWGVEPRCLRVRSSVEKNDTLGTITEYAESIGIPPRLRMAIRTVADELLTNAVYNAPVAADGAPRFASLPRTTSVTLDPGEEIEVRYCCDGRRFGLSITDPFGSLHPSQVQDYLAKGFRGGDGQVSEGSGGAGLGFFQVLDSLSHFVVDLDQGKRTEMIGLLDVSGGYRTLAGCGKSFNIFVQGAAG